MILILKAALHGLLSPSMSAAVSQVQLLKTPFLQAGDLGPLFFSSRHQPIQYTQPANYIQNSGDIWSPLPLGSKVSQWETVVKVLTVAYKDQQDQPINLLCHPLQESAPINWSSCSVWDVPCHSCLRLLHLLFNLLGIHFSRVCLTSSSRRGFRF